MGHSEKQKDFVLEEIAFAHLVGIHRLRERLIPFLERETGCKININYSDGENLPKIFGGTISRLTKTGNGMGYFAYELINGDHFYKGIRFLSGTKERRNLALMESIKKSLEHYFSQ